MLWHVLSLTPAHNWHKTVHNASILDFLIWRSKQYSVLADHIPPPTFRPVIDNVDCILSANCMAYNIIILWVSVIVDNNRHERCGRTKYRVYIRSQQIIYLPMSWAEVNRCPVRPAQINLDILPENRVEQLPSPSFYVLSILFPPHRQAVVLKISMITIIYGNLICISTEHAF